MRWLALVILILIVVGIAVGSVVILLSPYPLGR
jgi:hypothetical protein